MTINIKYVYYASILFTGLFLNSCGNNDKSEKGKSTKDSTKTTVKKETKKEPDTKYQRPPIVNIVDTITPKMLVIYCKDSAATFERIGLKLSNIYGATLAEYIKKNNLKMAGAPMAWYKKQPEGSGGKAPYFFEAGVPINKKGSKSMPGVQIREMSAGKAVIAHFFGPFELLPQGYDAIKEWMKENKKTGAGNAYEIYITDPIDKNGKPVDPYKIQTDIIFPIK